MPVRRRHRRSGRRSDGRAWVVMLLENEPYPADVRVRNEATALAQDGYRVTVLAPRGSGAELRRETVEGVEVVRFWLPATSQTATGFLLEYVIAHAQLARLTAVCLLRGADAVHANNPPDTLGAILACARLMGRATVFDNHDLFPELFAVRYPGSRLTVLLRVFQRFAFKVADLVLTTNESQREIVLAAAERDPASVVVVRNGPKLGTVSKAANRDTDSARDGLVRLAYLGALEPQDGVMSLAPMLSALADHGVIDVHLTVIGEGSCRAPLEAELARLGVDAKARFTGRVAHRMVPELLGEVDVCVDTAPCNELNHRSTMIKIAEYMAAGKPIVAFDLLETKRTAGQAALYAPCEDLDAFARNVERLAASADLRRQLLDCASERMQSLVWERSAQALLDAYRALLDSPDEWPAFR